MPIALILLLFQSFAPTTWEYPPTPARKTMQMLDDSGKRVCLSLSTDGVLTVWPKCELAGRKITHVIVEESK